MDVPLDAIIQMIIPLLVLELDVETFLDAHFHLDRFVQPRFILEDLDDEIFVLFDGGEEFSIDNDPDEVADRDVAAVVRFVGFFVGAEMEGDGGLGLEEGRWWLELFGEGYEVKVRSTVVYCVRL